MDDGSEGSGLQEGFWVGEWFVEPMLNRMVRKEERVSLEPKVMDVLVLMATRSGETVTKETFMEEVWSGTVVTDDVISRCISQLRKAFEDDAQNPVYIKTVRKKGYRLIAPVRAPDDDAGPATSDRDALGDQDTSPRDTGPRDDNAQEPASPGATQAAPGNQTGAEAAPGEAPSDGPPGASADETSAETSDGALQDLSDDLGALASNGDASEKWIVVVGGIFEQRWALIAVGLALLLVVAIGLAALLRPNVFRSGATSHPLQAVPITSFAGQELEPALSPDGSQVAFTWEGDEGGPRNIYLTQQGASTPLRLTNADTREWSPAWSPNGQEVAFVRALEEGAGIFIVSSRGGGAADSSLFRP